LIKETAPPGATGITITVTKPYFNLY